MPVELFKGKESNDMGMSMKTLIFCSEHKWSLHNVACKLTQNTLTVQVILFTVHITNSDLNLKPHE